MPRPHEDDPEVFFIHSLEQRKKDAMSPIKVARDEFIDTFKRQKKNQPDFSNPITHVIFNAWLAKQDGREWVTKEQKKDAQNKEEHLKKWSQTIALSREKQAVARAEAAEERKRLASLEYIRIKQEHKRGNK